MADEEMAARLLEDKATLASQITSAMEERHPDLFTRYGPGGRTKCVDDTVFHLEYLSAALDVGEPTIFSDYVSWLGRMLGARGIPLDDIDLNLEAMAKILNDTYGEEAKGAVGFLGMGRELLSSSR